MAEISSNSTPSNSEQTQDSLTQSIDDWIQKNGVGFELKVAGIVKKAEISSGIKIEIFHSRQYKDFDPKLDREVLREIDLVIRTSKLIGRNFWIHSWLIVECKNDSNPMVLYKNSQSQTPLYFQPIDDIWPSLTQGEVKLENILGSTTSGLLNQKNNVWCYSLNSKILNDSKNLAREGYLQVNAATQDIQKHARLTPGVAKELHIFIPVLATTAPIFSLWLDPEGEIKRERTQRELLVAQPSLLSDRQLGTWIVDAAGVEDLINDLISFQNNLDYRFE